MHMKYILVKIFDHSIVSKKKGKIKPYLGGELIKILKNKILKKYNLKQGFHRYEDAE